MARLLRHVLCEALTQWAKFLDDGIDIANQDLIAIIDGSGSLSEPGLDNLKKFVNTLLTCYHSVRFGAKVAKVCLVLFGIGNHHCVTSTQ